MSTENKEIKLKAGQDELATAIESFLKHDGNGVIRTDGAWAGTMPEGMSVEEGEKYDAHRARFTAASYIAVGRFSEKLHKENKDLNSTSADFELGKFADLSHAIDKIATVPDRRRNETTGLPEIVGEKTVYGHGKTTLRVKGGEGSKGELKNAREYISANFTSAFGS